MIPRGDDEAAGELAPAGPESASVEPSVHSVEPSVQGEPRSAGPTIVVTAVSLTPAGRAALAERLGPGHVVRDIREAGNTADVVLVPAVSGQLIGSLRAMFPGAKILVGEFFDAEFGVDVTGPMRRAMESGIDGYFMAADLAGVARITRDAASGRSVGILGSSSVGSLAQLGPAAMSVVEDAQRGDPLAVDVVVGDAAVGDVAGDTVVVGGLGENTRVGHPVVGQAVTATLHLVGAVGLRVGGSASERVVELAAELDAVPLDPVLWAGQLGLDAEADGSARAAELGWSVARQFLARGIDVVSAGDGWRGRAEASGIRVVTAHRRSTRRTDEPGSASQADAPV